VGIDTVILPTVNQAHTFMVEMPVTYKDVSIEAVIRLHEIIQMEKPANTSYYLRFLAEQFDKEERGFFQIGVRSGIGIKQEVLKAFPSGGRYPGEGEDERAREMRPSDMPHEETIDEFVPPARGKPPLPKAPKADDAPIEGQEVRTNLAGGFDQGARMMQAVTLDEAMEAPLATQITTAPTAPDEEPPKDEGGGTTRKRKKK
jgi:hypothetical protein